MHVHKILVMVPLWGCMKSRVYHTGKLETRQ